MKLSLRKICILVLALTSLPFVAQGEIRLVEKSGWTKLATPTRFQFNQAVGSVVNVTHFPGYSVFHPLSKLSVHVLQLTDKNGRVVAIAEEYIFAWRSIIRLSAVGADKREILMGMITESSDPDSPYQSRYSVSDRYGNPVAKGFDDRQEGEVVSYQFTHGGRDEAEAIKNTASNKINEWTLDVRDDRVISPLLIASLITFKKAAEYRTQQLVIITTLAILGGITYQYGSTIKNHVKNFYRRAKQGLGFDSGNPPPRDETKNGAGPTTTQTTTTTTSTTPPPTTTTTNPPQDDDRGAGGSIPPTGGSDDDHGPGGLIPPTGGSGDDLHAGEFAPPTGGLGDDHESGGFTPSTSGLGDDRSASEFTPPLTDSGNGSSPPNDTVPPTRLPSGLGNFPSDKLVQMGQAVHLNVSPVSPVPLIQTGAPEISRLEDNVQPDLSLGRRESFTTASDPHPSAESSDSTHEQGFGPSEPPLVITAVTNPTITPPAVGTGEMVHAISQPSETNGESTQRGEVPPSAPPSPVELRSPSSTSRAPGARPNSPSSPEGKGRRQASAQGTPRAARARGGRQGANSSASSSNPRLARGGEIASVDSSRDDSAQSSRGGGRAKKGRK